MIYTNEKGTATVFDERIIGGLVLAQIIALRSPIVLDLIETEDLAVATSHAENTKRIVSETWSIYTCDNCSKKIWKYDAATKGNKTVFCNKNCATEYKDKKK